VDWSFLPSNWEITNCIFHYKPSQPLDVRVASRRKYYDIQILWKYNEHCLNTARLNSNWEFDFPLIGCYLSCNKYVLRVNDCHGQSHVIEHLVPFAERNASQTLVIVFYMSLLAYNIKESRFLNWLVHATPVQKTAHYEQIHARRNSTYDEMELVHRNSFLGTQFIHRIFSLWTQIMDR